MSDTTSSTPPAPEVHPVIAKLSDFSDRISPMIVKELRQGLRTRAFTGIFLVIQIILGFTMVMALVTDSGNVGDSITRAVIFLFSVVALILQPLRGGTAVSTELKDDTLEIMSLTRLSSVRIVYGKWASLVCQTALILSAIIPYVVMRYFFGGMQVVAEVSIIVAVFVISVCLTAVTVGLSCNKAALIRSLIPLILIPLGFMGISGAVFGSEFAQFLRFFSFSDKDVVIALVIFFLICIYVGYYFLDMGVSRIAAIAENHSFRKRIISLVAMASAVTAVYFTDARVTCFAVALIFVVTIGLDVCTEYAVLVPSTVVPFVKRGFVGKLAGRFLYPGWHSGVFLLLVLFFAVLFIGEATFSKHFYTNRTVGLNSDITLVILGIFYSLIGPLLILRLFEKRITNPFTGFIGIVVGCAILTSVISILGEIGKDSDGTFLLFSWIPGMWLTLAAETNESNVAAILTAAFLVGAWGSLIILSLREFKNTAALEARAEKSLAPRAESEE